ncbi:MAG: hypothetical protein ACLF0P_09810 [Thermoanaerobaculia bacterium]
MDVSSPERAPASHLARRMAQALDELERARPFAKASHQPWAFDLALELMRSSEGLAQLYGMAPRFDPAGLFHGGDWAHPANLQPSFVTNTLRGGHPHFVAVECLSQLRMLAIALGDAEHPEVSPEQAREFLEDVLAHNLDLLFPEATEASRGQTPDLLDVAGRVAHFIGESLGLAGVLESLVSEAERIVEQRPILVDRAVRLIETAAQTVRHEGDETTRARAERLFQALHGPTPLAHSTETGDAYAEALAGLPAHEVRAEAQGLAASMRATGLVCPEHAALLRFVCDGPDELLATALGLDPVGRSSLEVHGALVRDVIADAVHPATAQSIYGLARLLERGVLYFHPAAAGLRRLIGMEILPEVEEVLRSRVPPDAEDTVRPGAVLVAGALQVLGQPLGVGQGDNPTCQSARAISLWSQSDVGYLLDMVARAVRDGEVVMHFEGLRLASSELGPGLAVELHTELDPVSLVLVPHLDRIYGEMSRLVEDRLEDGHKWINPEFHGWWVHRGFAAAVGETTGVVTDFDGFVRGFYSFYHPACNGGHEVVYPQPAGLAITDLWGNFVGWHAVSIQRVEPDPEGELRVYFYNPNNEGRQKWGQGIVTSTGGHGEEPGESSLPFHLYAARTYVFHYNPREQGDLDAVPAEEVARVTELARTSWAAHLPWDG